MLPVFVEKTYPFTRNLQRPKKRPLCFVINDIRLVPSRNKHTRAALAHSSPAPYRRATLVVMNTWQNLPGKVCSESLPCLEQSHSSPLPRRAGRLRLPHSLSTSQQDRIATTETCVARCFKRYTENVASTPIMQRVRVLLGQKKQQNLEQMITRTPGRWNGRCKGGGMKPSNDGLSAHRSLKFETAVTYIPDRSLISLTGIVTTAVPSTYLHAHKKAIIFAA